MKIKDNLDLQGYLLQNFCVDNYDSLDGISNKGDGRMVFLTGNSTDAKYRHVNVWDGTNFKALAYLEDVAMNDDFIALQEKVDSIDEMLNLESSQTVIDTWEEVKAFLDSVPEGLELMDLLNSKLSTSGGTINSGSAQVPLMLSSTGATTRIAFLKGESLLGYLAFAGVDTPQYITSAGREYDLLHEGNYSDYALPLTGGNLTNLLFLEYANPRIAFKSDANTTLGAVGFKDGVLSANITADNKWYTLLHSGNVGEYNAGGLVEEVVTDLNSASSNRIFTMRSGYGSLEGNKPNTSWITGITLRVAQNNAYQIQIAASEDNKMYFRSENDGDWSAWKTIAFTDSNVASAQALKNIYDYASLDNTQLVSNFGITTYGLRLYGKDLYLQDNNGYKFIINSSGNVTIGNQDYAESNRKLFVNGSASFVIGTQNNITDSDELDLTKTFTITSANTTSNYGLHAWINTSGCVNLQSSYAAFAANKNVYSIALNPLGGNVLIGTTTDNGAKLHVAGDISLTTAILTNGQELLRRYAEGLYIGYGTAVYGSLPTLIWGNEIRFVNKNGKVNAYLTNEGDLHVTGNIIADGEVSAGGAGEEGENESGGGREPWASDPFAITSTTMEFSHNLGTDNVIVQVYEQDATSGHWSMILVDVEIIDNANIALHFGRTESTIHKVIVMG